MTKKREVPPNPGAGGGVTRIAFLGSPEAAVPSLNALVEAGHEVALVVTREDKRRGRGNSVAPTPVKSAAVEFGIPVSHSLGDVMKARADLAVVVAYGRIIPAALLTDIPFLNIHFSLLPRWRGAAPVERAILAGDTVTGVCVMKLDEGLDTGPVYACRQISLNDTITRSELTDQLAQVGAQLLVDLLAGGVGGLPEPVGQTGEPVYAAKIESDDLRIDWGSGIEEIKRKVRLERAWTMFRGKRLIIGEVANSIDQPAGDRLSDQVGTGQVDIDQVGTTSGDNNGKRHANMLRSAPPVETAGALTIIGHTPVVRCGDGAIAIRTVQPEGHTKMTGEEWARGVRIREAEKFDQ